MMADNPYPKFLYRHHPAADWVDGVPCEIMQVLDADEEKAGKADGWHDNVADAAPKGKLPTMKDVDATIRSLDVPKRADEDPRPALRVKYEELTGKKAFGGWSAEQLQSKIEALNG